MYDVQRGQSQTVVFRNAYLGDTYIMKTKEVNYHES